MTLIIAQETKTDIPHIDALVEDAEGSAWRGAARCVDVLVHGRRYAGAKRRSTLSVGEHEALAVGTPPLVTLRGALLDLVDGPAFPRAEVDLLEPGDRLRDRNRNR
mgnify:CR=1 FL=1